MSKKGRITVIGSGWEEGGVEGEGAVSVVPDKELRGHKK